MINDDENHFGKQRRNLILVSALLLAIDFLNVNYDDFSLFNSGIKINNPEGIPFILWILWGYFLLRFFTLFFEVKNKFLTPIKEKLQNFEKKYAITEYIKKNEVQYKENVEAHVKVRSTYFEPKISVYNKELNPRDYSDSGVIIPHLKIIQFTGIAFLCYVFGSHYFFEYYFPIIFALLPLITLIP